MERRVAVLKERLFGNQKRDRANDAGPVSIARRINVGSGGLRSSLYGPTATHREMFSIGKREFAKLKRELDTLVENELPELERKLDEAGLAWTPGRGVPGN